MSEGNISITNTAGDSLSRIRKVGVGLFLGSCFALLWAGFGGQKNNEWIGTFAFSAQLIGAILFTYDRGNWKKGRLSSFNLVTLTSFLFSSAGFSLFVLGWLGWSPIANITAITFTLWTLAILLFMQGGYQGKAAGIKNDKLWQKSLTGRGVLAWALGFTLTFFYIQLYWGKDPFPVLVEGLNPLSEFFRNKAADKWFLYGTIYTFAILFLGIKFIIKYRHNRYQLWRTVVVILSQVIMAYFIPNTLEALNYDSASAVIDGNETYLGYYSGNPVNTWPLNYSAYEPGTLKAYVEPTYQPFGIAYLVWGILLFLVVTPVLTYFVGKRWYCSWVCGCGGLAETAGDSFRHLSNKSVKAWKIERWTIHSVMVFVLLMTLAVLYTYFSKNEFLVGFVSLRKWEFLGFASLFLIGFGYLLYRWNKKQPNTYLKSGLIILVVLFVLLWISALTGGQNLIALKSTSLKKIYGFLVGASFSGIIGVGFYPILGNRVWCRFGCPMAGYMGIFQRFKSKFRITTNGGQCISCGNCSTYCEQGIDVRAYAQKGENIVRASCVGCGVCSAVCPRGVLKLENGPDDDRFLISQLIKK